MANTATTENLVVVNRFDLEIDGVTVGQVLSASGIGDQTEVIDAPTSKMGKVLLQKAAGNTTFTDLNITMHLTDEKFLSDWMLEVQDGKFSTYRRNGSVIMGDTAGTEQVRANFFNAFPTNMTVTGVSAGGNDPMTVSLTIAHEGLEMVFS